MDVGFYHGGIHAQLLAIFQTELDSGLHYRLVDGLHGGWGEAVESAVEGIVLGHQLAIEIRKGAQGIAVLDAFAPLAIVPVLDAHEHERAPGLRRVIPLQPVWGFCSPRTQSWRTGSTRVAGWSRKVRMPCRSGSRWTPWRRHSRSAKLSWGGARRLRQDSPGAAVDDSTRRCVPRCLSVGGNGAATVGGELLFGGQADRFGAATGVADGQDPGGRKSIKFHS